MQTLPTQPRRTLTAAASTVAGSLGIAIGLAAISYDHIRQFAIDAGAQTWEAGIIAATVDGLIVMAIGAIAHARRTGTTPPPVVKISLVVGLVATTGANVHHGLGHGWQGVVVSLWVPIAAELAYQLAMWVLRTGRRRPDMVVCGAFVRLSAVSGPLSEHQPEGARGDTAATNASGHQPARPAAASAPRRSAPAPRTPATARRVSDSASGQAATVSELADMSERDQRALEIVRAQPDITGAALAEVLGVVPRTGQRILNRTRELLRTNGLAVSESAVVGHDASDSGGPNGAASEQAAIENAPDVPTPVGAV